MLPPHRVGRLVVAAGMGVLVALGHPPAGVPFAAVAGYVGVLLMVRGRGSAVGAADGFVFGGAMFAVLVSWSARFGAPALVALVFSQALFFVPFGVAAAARVRGWRWVALTTGTLTLSEAVRARWPLGGFEWGQLGYVWHATPVRGLASVVGVLGLTAVTAAACAAAAVMLHRRQLPGRAGLLALALAAAAGLTLSARDWTTPAGGLDVAVVQVAPVCRGPVVLCPSEDERLLDAFARLTRVSGTRPSLFIWGEGALGGGSIKAAGARAVAAAGVRSRLLAGVTAPGGPGMFVNANVLYDSSGKVAYRYDKRHPVPFGEYVPWRQFVAGVGDVGTLVPVDMVRGTRPGRVPVSATVLGTVSSFEGSFSREVRASAADPEVQGIAILTSQASYGRSAASDQFLAMAGMRAAELQKPAIVAATTGRSALFEPRGGLVSATPLLRPSVLDVRVPLRRGTTPFGRVGDAPVLVAGVLTVVGALPGWRRRIKSWRARLSGLTTRRSVC